MRLHADDSVVVIAGKDRGKIGRILRILTGKNRVVVAGVNLRTRHIRKTPQSPGRIVRYEAALDASNVMFIDPKGRKRTRIGYRIDERGKKERFAKKSDGALMSGKKLKRLVEEGMEKEQTKKRENKKQKDGGPGFQSGDRAEGADTTSSQP